MPIVPRVLGSSTASLSVDASLRVTSLRARDLLTLPVIRPGAHKEDAPMTTQKITLSAVEDDGAVR